MVYDDPFSRFSLAPAPAVLATGTRDQADLWSPLYHHAHEIAASAFLYSVLLTAAPAISKAAFGAGYTSLSRRTKANFDIHIVALVQSLVSIGSLIPLIGDPVLNADPVFAYHPYAAFVSAITIGYFVWDLFICLRHLRLFGPGFLLHAAAALTVFVSTLQPFCLGWVAGFLIFELSSPFVNINWFVKVLPEGTFPNWVQLLNGLVLIVSFFTVRILWGFYAIFAVLRQFIELRDQIPLTLAVLVVSLNFALDVLNLYWFSKMLAIARKRLNQSRTKKTE